MLITIKKTSSRDQQNSNSKSEYCISKQVKAIGLGFGSSSELRHPGSCRISGCPIALCQNRILKLDDTFYVDIYCAYSDYCTVTVPFQATRTRLADTTALTRIQYRRLVSKVSRSLYTNHEILVSVEAFRSRLKSWCRNKSGTYPPHGYELNYFHPPAQQIKIASIFPSSFLVSLSVMESVRRLRKREKEVQLGEFELHRVQSQR